MSGDKLPIVKRLLRTKTEHQVRSGFGGLISFHDEAVTREVPVNPDGPEAATTITELVSALEPFAKALAEWGDEPEHPDHRDLWDHPIAMCVTLGDFRRAAALFAQREQSQ